MKHTLKAITLTAAMTCCALAQADTGKLLLTGGVSSIDGAAGGGLTPWAVIGSNATDGEIGFTAHATRVGTQDYGLLTYGVAMGYKNRVEVSLSHQEFDASVATGLNAIAAFGVQSGQRIGMDTIGLKVRVAGDAVLDSDSLMPQLAVGVAFKSVEPGSINSVFNFLGVKKTGTDYYVSATKLFLAQSLLVNGTLRYTNANQNGLLGFGAGSTGVDSHSLRPEFSVAYLLRKNLAIGAEYRFKPNNLESSGRAAGLGSALAEDDWKDLFIVWAPSKNLSLTLAYVDLGRIIPGITANRSQTGYYLSGQLAY